MNLEKMVNCINLNADISTGVCDQFIEIILGQ